jgi:hypothetical protein
MNRETFLSFRGFLWFWISCGIVVISVVLYVLDDSIGGRNGGTVLGYSLGVLATAGILYLMWYGIRKRSYYARITTLRAVLSSHVWIGVALVFIVPLHSGFSFNYNVHTLAYVLMLLTIATGVWGVVLFRRYPYSLASQRGGASTSQLAASIYSISEDIRNILGNREIQRSDEFLEVAHKLRSDSETGSLWKSLWKSLFFHLNDHPDDDNRIAHLIEKLPSHEQTDALSLVTLVKKKISLERKISEEAKAIFLLRAWLYLHVPLSFALCVSLFIHIFSVFYYW